MTSTYPTTCAHCGVDFESASPHGRYCRPAHRVAAHQARRDARARRDAVVAELLRRRAASILLAEIEAQADAILLAPYTAAHPLGASRKEALHV